MKEEEKTQLSNTAAAVTDEATIIQIDILHPTWWQRLLRKRKRAFKLSPATLGTLVKISRELLSIEIEEADKSNIMLLTQKLMLAHSSRMAKVVAIAIVNSKADPPQSLIEFLEYNLNAEELATVAMHVVNKMDINSFVRSIISIKGVNILEMSLPNQGS